MPSNREKRLTTRASSHTNNVESAIINQAAKIIELERKVEELQGAIMPIPRSEKVIQPSCVLGRDEKVVEQNPCWHICAVCGKTFDSTKSNGGVLNTVVNLAPYKPTVENKEHMKGYLWCGMHCHELLETTLRVNRGEVSLRSVPLGQISYPPTQMSGAVKAIIKLQEESKKVN